MSLKPLTDKQESILNYIKKHIDEMGYSPTYSDIRYAFGYTSANGAVEHVKLMVKKGYLKVSPGVARSIVVL